MQLYIQILEGISIGVSILFLLCYIYRITQLNRLLIPQNRLSCNQAAAYPYRYPWPRLTLCLLYLTLSLLYLLIKVYQGYQKQDQWWMLEIGVGQLLDAILLGVQMVVIRKELVKERPYSPLHLLFSIFLNVVSLVRLIVVCLGIAKGLEGMLEILGTVLAVAFLINSLLLLIYWIAKRQEFPQYQKIKYFNFEELSRTESSRDIVDCGIEFTAVEKSKFYYIQPTVSMEDGQFRIVLQVEDSQIFQIVNVNRNMPMEMEMEESQDRQEKRSRRERIQSNERTEDKAPSKGRMKVISDQCYSVNQILELYKICGRFNISQRLNFSKPANPQFEVSLQKLLEQVLSIRQSYQEPLLTCLHLRPPYPEIYQTLLQSIPSSNHNNGPSDKNSALVSICIHKHLLIDDYYLFYLDVAAVDGEFETHPMRRYNDFQMFHVQITGVIKKRYAGRYQLPPLPKKYLFGSDESKIMQRRVELEGYIRAIANDYVLMMEAREVRKVTLEFLGQLQPIILTPVSHIFQSFFTNLQIQLGSTSKRLIHGQYVTFYEFKVAYNNLVSRTLRKRFTDFVYLHQNLQRWMTNTMINYKFLTLPEKHLYKSSAQRHEKLKMYLQYLVRIPDIWKVYEVNVFFKVGNNGMRDISLSKILSQHDDSRIRTSGGSNEPHRFLVDDSFESQGRELLNEIGRSE